MFNQIRKFSARIPMIKFRQGQVPSGHGAGAHMTGQPGQAPQVKSNKVVSGQVIEDWQLPRKYRRRPISEDECMAINMGGAI